MTKRFCFFCGSSDLNIGIPIAYEPGFVPFNEVIRQCELVFGVKASKLENADISGEFILFNVIGFHTIYGITKNRCTDDSADELLKVIYLTELNEFLMAETIEDKKALYLTHCENYMRRFLDYYAIEKTKQDIFTPILDYVVQQFHLAVYALLHDGLKQTPKDGKRIQRIQNLQKIGFYITELLFIAMKITSFKEKELTQDILEKLLKPIDKLIIPSVGNAHGLDYQTFISKDDAISNTLELFYSSEHLPIVGVA